MSCPDSLSVILLAGGKGERMGYDKALIRVNGTRLFDVTRANIPSHHAVIAVSPQDLDYEPTVCEQPPFGGPVAGIAAALPLVSSELVAVLTVDAPAAPSLLPQMRAQLGNHDAVAISDGSHVNALCSLWHTTALRAAIDTLPQIRNIAARCLLNHADVHVLAGDGSERDYDTRAELSQLGRVSPED
ncbi:molybdenum cofactor guanylyltransferase [Corynebacterium gerontici]|uniref:Molybdopterin-guanine dinucleotide biosynthesis protein MobA n=1 Tax=Corynebacterium gerontici TaxID=2079234 RepID=A0A3G6J2N2_9CORY|nr:NTP transferase domain-containing protein [Corynebacterium gerontici]AZA11228.1 molybdopterin-guanine dinucleotide biosynthesis protein MobA [Corynebacterium gerontici]